MDIKADGGRANASKANFAKIDVTLLDPEKLVGQPIRVYWPLDQRFYRGEVESYDASTALHVVMYDDGEQESLLLCEQTVQMDKELRDSAHGPNLGFLRTTAKALLACASGKMAGTEKRRALPRSALWEVERVMMRAAMLMDLVEELHREGQRADGGCAEQIAIVEKARLPDSFWAATYQYPVVTHSWAGCVKAEADFTDLLQTWEGCMTACLLANSTGSADQADYRQIYRETAMGLRVCPHAAVGLRVRVLWPLDEAWYAGTVAAFNPSTGRHKVEYDDGAHEELFLAAERVRVALRPGQRLQAPRREQVQQLVQHMRSWMNAVADPHEDKDQVKRVRVAARHLTAALDPDIVTVPWPEDASAAPQGDGAQAAGALAAAPAAALLLVKMEVDGSGATAHVAAAGIKEEEEEEKGDLAAAMKAACVKTAGEGCVSGAVTYPKEEEEEEDNAATSDKLGRPCDAEAGDERQRLLDAPRQLLAGELVWGLMGDGWLPALVLTPEEAVGHYGLGRPRKGKQDVFLMFFHKCQVARLLFAREVVTWPVGLRRGLHVAARGRSSVRLEEAVMQAMNYLTNGDLPECMIPQNGDDNVGRDTDEEEEEDKSDIDVKPEVDGKPAGKVRRAAGGKRTLAAAAALSCCAVEVRGEVAVTQLGHIVWASPAFHTARVLLPVGYEAVRLLRRSKAAPKLPSQLLVTITCTAPPLIRPCFRITEVITGQEGAPQLGKTYEGSSPDDAWQQLWRQHSTQPSERSGDEVFGLTLPAVARSLQALPGAERCVHYRAWLGPPPTTPQLTKEDIKVRATVAALEAAAAAAAPGAPPRLPPLHQFPGVCDVCGVDEDFDGNEMLECDSCRLQAHVGCMGVQLGPKGKHHGEPWICLGCSAGPAGPPPCCLCPVSGRAGFMCATDDGRFCHLVCAYWCPEVHIDTDADTGRVVAGNVDAALDKRAALCCVQCGRRGGACLQCAGHRNCCRAFHITCARDAGQRLLEVRDDPLKEPRPPPPEEAAGGWAAPTTGAPAAVKPPRHHSNNNKGMRGSERGSSAKPGSAPRRRAPRKEYGRSRAPRRDRGKGGRWEGTTWGSTRGLAMCPEHSEWPTTEKRWRLVFHHAVPRLPPSDVVQAMWAATHAPRPPQLPNHRPAGLWIQAEQSPAKRARFVQRDAFGWRAAGAPPQAGVGAAGTATSDGDDLVLRMNTESGEDVAAKEHVKLDKGFRLKMGQEMELKKDLMKGLKKNVRKDVAQKVDVAALGVPAPGAVPAVTRTTAPPPPRAPCADARWSKLSKYGPGGGGTPAAAPPGQPGGSSLAAYADGQVDVFVNAAQRSWAAGRSTNHLPAGPGGMPGSTSPLCLSQRFKLMRRTMGARLRLGRSPIHGIGVFAALPIAPLDLVAEYVGELIPNVESDNRERLVYNLDPQLQGGTYVFSLDSKRSIDATFRGNAARFINHSCEPNCFSRVVTVTLGKGGAPTDHIVISARRWIRPGEELTYDYQMGDNTVSKGKSRGEKAVKLVCRCGAPRCVSNGVVELTRMNWSSEDEEDAPAGRQQRSRRPKG